MRGRRARLIGAGLLIVALAALLYLLRPGESARVTAEPAKPSVPSAPPVAPVVQVPHELAPQSVPDDQITPLVPNAAPPIPLPPDTQLLAEEFVPGTTEWEEVPLVDGGAQIIRFLPAHYNVIAPAPIVLYLEVVDQATRKRIEPGVVSARIRSMAAPDDAWIELAMTDDGTRGDQTAHDGRYTASLTPSAAQQERLLGHVVAEGIVDSPSAGRRRIPQALIYTRGPRARLTGRWRDEQRDGHLYLSAEVEVDDAGVFTLMAQVVGPAREPIALTRTMTSLDRGTHWMTMRVWGKALRDTTVDGPYEVRNVLLTRDMNERHDYDPGPTVLLAHRTRPYRATEFTADAYVEPTTARGEEIGPDHPSQRDNSRPEHGESERMSHGGR